MHYNYTEQKDMSPHRMRHFCDIGSLFLINTYVILRGLNKSLELESLTPVLKDVVFLSRHFNKLLMALSIVDSLLIFVEIAETSIIGTLWKWSEESGPPLWYGFDYIKMQKFICFYLYCTRQ